ncbi:MAG: transcriptional repressor [Muribaculaceae bacterium]|nr:transcriptional repressor [Muribaculaceae bacterium]MDE6321047.1 transcriptional repressor [Muribaculaceae bacterium]
MMIDEKSRAAAHATLTAYLNTQKMRRTPERFAILDKALDMPDHFTIDSLWEALTADNYLVSRATVYSTLKLLCESCIVRRHNFEGRVSCYEKAITPTVNHQHLICTECGKVREVRDPELMRLLESRRYSTFHPGYFAIYAYGICNRCAKRRRKKLP